MSLKEKVSKYCQRGEGFSSPPASDKERQAGIINKKLPARPDPRSAGRDTFPLLPLRDVVVFPYMVVPLLVGRRMSINAVDMAWRKKDKKIVLVTQKNPSLEVLKPEDLYRIGTLGEILQLVKIDDGSIKILVEGIKRVKIESFSSSSA